jgi:hypothetical protein
VSVAQVSARSGQLRFVGLGNVEGRVYAGSGSSGLTPRPGTLGMNHQTPKLQGTTADWPAGSMLIMHSDGIRQHFDLSSLGGDLQRRDPSVIAAVLHRDYGRGRDDATVVVVRDLRGAP